MRRFSIVICAVVFAAGFPARGDASPTIRCDPDCNTRVTTTLGPANEVSLAVDPTDPNNLIAAAKDYSDAGGQGCHVHNVWAGIYHSSDGGRTWSEQRLPAEDIPEGTTCISDPVVMFASDGTAYYYGLTLPHHALIVERSTDRGATWELRGIVTYNADKEWGAVDPVSGRLWAVWTYATFGPWWDLRAAYSDDQGATWTQRALGGVTPLGVGTGAAIAVGSAAIGDEPPVYVAYWGVAAIMVAVSRDRGRTWATAPVRPVAPEANTHGYRLPTVVSMAVDHESGRVYVAYHDFAKGTGQARVAWSSRRAAAWVDTPVDVRPGALLRDEFMPAIAVGGSGDVHVFYYRADDAGSLDLYYSHSANGLRWDLPARVTTVASDPSAGFHQGGFNFIGDYIGAAAGETVAYAAWADFRNDRSDVYAAAIQG